MQSVSTNLNTFRVLLALLVLTAITVSCDEDATTLGGNIIGGNNFETSVFEDSQVISYTARTRRVQTNGLASYQLGVYEDPIYGKTTSNVLTQLFLDTPGPIFNDEPEFQTVTLSIPYFSRLDITADEPNTYLLDSVYGDQPVMLQVYRSNYFLQDFDPDTGFEQPQEYFSDQGPLFESFLGELIFEDISFLPSTDAITINEGEDDEEVLAPQMRVDLPVEFWKELILDMEGSPELSSNNAFKDYFRGMYFKITPLGDEGVLFYFDITEASLDIEYTYQAIDVADTDNDGDTTDNITIMDDLGLSFAGITVNVFDSEYNPAIDLILDSQDMVNGEPYMYLKGGEGSIGVIELFGPDTDGDGEADQLTELKENDWLINEANLTVFVDTDQVPGGQNEPERLFLYDMDNKRVLIDYELDQTFANTANELKSGHLGIVERDASDNGISYKLRLTTHINNIIRRDSTNVRLGLAVVQDVLTTNFRTVATALDDDINSVPSGGVNSQEGTIVHGNASPVSAKRLKLTIYYTDPE